MLIMENELTLTEKQLKEFGRIWFIFGNDGPKCTLFNHKLVQGFYQYKENRIKEYRQGNKNMARNPGLGKEYVKRNGVTEECIAACQEILNNP